MSQQLLSLILSSSLILILFSIEVDSRSHLNQWNGCDCSKWNPNSLTDDDQEVESDITDDSQVDKYLLYQLGKRGLDLGLSRGFSAKKAAKHLVGLAAASLPTNPGRRKRSDLYNYLM